MISSFDKPIFANAWILEFISFKATSKN